MENHSSALSFAISVHERLTRDSYYTVYQSWCARVHSMPLAPSVKWEYLLSWKIDPSDYDNPTVFASDWQLFKLLSKLCIGNSPAQADKDVALAKFLNSEHRCSLVNDHFLLNRGSSFEFNLSKRINSIVNYVLGDPSDFALWVESSSVPEEVLGYQGLNSLSRELPVGFRCSLEPEFGPGTSVGRTSRGTGSLIEKTQGTITRDCLWLFDWIKTIWEGFRPCDPVICSSSVLTYVAKRVGEARTICYEPSLNMLVQKLIGAYIKQRMKSVLRIDLSDQSRNKSLARLGSLCDSWATIDMSSASDLWSTMFVMNHVSFSWFHLLDSCRSKNYTIYDKKGKGKTCSFHKFSTMGNGFTFELETLLFYAVCKSAIDMSVGDYQPNDIVSVYGDDIIIPKEHYDVCTGALNICGHIVNEEKSFRSGPFRESCGGDYFNGFDVTPCKIKDLSLENPQSLANVYNQLFIASRRSYAPDSGVTRYTRALQYVFSRTTTHHPGISEGPIEYEDLRFVYPHPKAVMSPSNRWLFSDSPKLNYIWSPYVCDMVCKYVIQIPRLDKWKQEQDFGCLSYELDSTWPRIWVNGGIDRGLPLDVPRLKKNPLFRKLPPVRPKSIAKNVQLTLDLH